MIHIRKQQKIRNVSGTCNTIKPRWLIPINNSSIKDCSIAGKEEEEKKKAGEKSEDIDKMSKIDQNQNGIANGGGAHSNKIMIE